MVRGTVQFCVQIVVSIDQRPTCPVKLPWGDSKLVLALEGLRLSAVNAYLNRKLNYSGLFLNRSAAYESMSTCEFASPVTCQRENRYGLEAAQEQEETACCIEWDISLA